jgi:hypothetical protein
VPGRDEVDHLVMQLAAGNGCVGHFTLLEIDLS